MSESAEVETEGFLTPFEKDYPDEQWLMLFRTQNEAKAYIVANVPAPAPEDYQWACVEFTPLDLLEFLKDNPTLEGVLFNADSDEARFVSAAVLIGELNKALGEPEGDAA